MDRAYLTGIYVLHPLFGINTSADILLARVTSNLARLSLYAFNLPRNFIFLSLPTLSGKIPMVLQFIAIVTLTELSRPFSRKGDPFFSLQPYTFFYKANILALIKKKVERELVE